MLPILPALLLLILQGPSSIEKMALDGRLPAALEAVSRQMEARDHLTGGSSEADAAVLASLLALSGDPDLSHALFQLLAIEPSIGKVTQTQKIEPDDQITPVPIDSQAGQSLPEGCLKSQRSRDGPF